MIKKQLYNNLRRCFSTSETSAIAIRFEKEWEQLLKEDTEKIYKQVNSSVNDGQRNKIKLLANAVSDLNPYEIRFLNELLREKLLINKDISPIHLYTYWPSIKKLDDGTYPEVNPNWFMQQEALAKMFPDGVQDFCQIFAGYGGGGGDGSSSGSGSKTATTATDKTQQVEAPKQEAPKVEEKNTFDVELTSLDPAAKIKIIKEVRTITGLGLKEAKDAVEKGPFILKKGLKKEDADKIVEELQKIGCKITLL